MAAFIGALKTLGGIVSLASKIFDWLTAFFHDKEVRDAQRTADHDQQATAAVREIDTAQRARDRVDADLSAHPDRVRQPDADSAPTDSSGIS